MSENSRDSRDDVTETESVQSGRSHSSHRSGHSDSSRSSKGSKSSKRTKKKKHTSTEHDKDVQKYRHKTNGYNGFVSREGKLQIPSEKGLDHVYQNIPFQHEDCADVVMCKDQTTEDTFQPITAMYTCFNGIPPQPCKLAPRLVNRASLEIPETVEEDVESMSRSSDSENIYVEVTSNICGNRRGLKVLPLTTEDHQFWPSNPSTSKY